MKQLSFLAQQESATDQLGGALADVLPDRAVIALCGTLGAGKTRLTQALATACGIAREDVVSPTFVLCHQYRGRRAINHFDAYRVRDDDEFLELGVEEYFDSDGVTLIEWADRVLDCLPDEYLRIDIELLGEECREFRIGAVGAAYESVIARLAVLLGGAAECE